MIEVFRFFTTRGYFGVLELPDEGPAIAFVPSKDARPFQLAARQIDACMKSASNEHDENTRFDAVCKVLRLDGISVRRESVQPAILPGGGYFPRIWRGQYSPTDPLSVYCPIKAYEVYESSFVQSISAVRSLFEELEDLFRYIEPSRRNDVTYSHKIRELLILACTELETSWRGVWNNNFSPPSGNLTTNQYVQLSEPLGLPCWSVMLADYPDYDRIQPFQGWDAANPTKSLSWYNSYNATKHDRETNFQEASLANLILSMAALHVQLSA